ncbi:MAG: acyltransferase [Kofleriaceae bacterium]
MATTRLGVLNGLRGIALLAVVHHHLLSPLFPIGWATVDLGAAAMSVGAPLSHGYVGVHLFFVLSGFVLYLPYADGRRAMATRADLIGFYRRRAARLLPLYYVCLAVTLALVAPPPPTAAGLGDALLLGTFTFPFTTSMWSPPQNWVLWSLGVEVWLSVLFPLLLVAAARIGVVRLTAVAVAVALATRLLGHGRAAFDVGNPYLDALSDSVLGRLDDFVLGMAALAWWRRRPDGSAAAPLAAGAALVWLATAARDEILLGAWPQAAWPLTHLGFAAGFALIVVGALRARGAVRRLLAAPPLQVIGMMCYSLYVWHDLVIRHVVGGQLDAGHLALGAALLSALAALTYRYVEFRAEPSWRALVRPAP